jgi:hypothetical protein
MRTDNVVTDGDECLVWALPALRLRLSADAPDPFVPTHGRVARLPCFWIFPPARRYILAPAKQAPEKRDLRGSRRGHRDGSNGTGRLSCLIRLRALKRTQSLGDFRAFPIERSQSALQGRNLSKDVVRVSDRMMSVFVEAPCRSRSGLWPASNA